MVSFRDCATVTNISYNFHSLVFDESVNYSSVTVLEGSLRGGGANGL